MTSPTVTQTFTQEAVEAASREVARLQKELDVTNADHIALWIEANLVPDEPMSQCVSWFACRIAEAYEHAVESQRKSFGYLPGNYSIICLDCRKEVDGCAKLSTRCAACADTYRTSGEGLFEAIQHGDEDHRSWLKEAIDAFFAGRDVPEPRGKGSPEGRSNGAGEDAEAKAEADEYLVRKNGYWYRPNAQGYTLCQADAGRFTLDEAIKHSHPNGPNGPRDGITYEPAPPIATLTAPPTSEERLRTALADLWGIVHGCDLRLSVPMETVAKVRAALSNEGAGK